MVQVREIDTRRRDDGFLESEARVDAADGATITAGDLDLDSIDHLQVSVSGQGVGGADAAYLVTKASLHSPGQSANSITMGVASLSGGSFGSLTASSASALLHVNARGVQS